MPEIAVNANEIKSNTLVENNKVSRIKIIIDYQVKSFKNLFSHIKCIDSITFKKYYRNNITEEKSSSSSEEYISSSIYSFPSLSFFI